MAEVSDGQHHRGAWGGDVSPSSDLAAVRLDALWPTNVMFVGSSGGHLAQLHHLDAWWRHRERTWVTFDTPDARSLLSDAGETVVWAHYPTTRNIPNLLRNLRLAFREVRRRRPDLVVSAGAAVAFPFFLVARLFGTRCVFIEVLDRIDSRTVTGRLCLPLSHLFLVQTEQQQRLYRGSRVIGELL